MAHSFLLEPSSWNIKGYWLKPKTEPILLEGRIQVTWKRKNWFKLTTHITCQDIAKTQIIYQSRGNLNRAEKYYTYVSQHSLLGNIEGEGRLGFESIIQYYWFMGTASNQKGLDTYYRVDPDTYYLTSSILQGHSVQSTIEATLKR